MSNVNDARTNRDWWKKELEIRKEKVREAEQTLASRESELKRAEEQEKRDEQREKEKEKSPAS